MSSHGQLPSVAATKPTHLGIRYSNRSDTGNYNGCDRSGIPAASSNQRMHSQTSLSYISKAALNDSALVQTSARAAMTAHSVARLAAEAKTARTAGAQRLPNLSCAAELIGILPEVIRGDNGVGNSRNDGKCSGRISSTLGDEQHNAASKMAIGTAATLSDEPRLRNVAAHRWACQQELRQSFLTRVSTANTVATECGAVDARASSFFPAVSSRSHSLVEEPTAAKAAAAAAAPLQAICESSWNGTTSNTGGSLLVALCSGSPSLTQALLRPLLGPRHAASMLSLNHLSRPPFKLLWNITARLHEILVLEVPAASITSPLSKEGLQNQQRCDFQVLKRGLEGAFGGRNPVATNTRELSREERCAFLSKLIDAVNKALNVLNSDELNEKGNGEANASSSSQLLSCVSPSKVVAGLETDRTNVLLQLLALTAYASVWGSSAKERANYNAYNSAIRTGKEGLIDPGLHVNEPYLAQADAAPTAPPAPTSAAAPADGVTGNDSVLPYPCSPEEGTDAAHPNPTHDNHLAPLGQEDGFSAGKATSGAAQAVRSQLLEFNNEMALLQGEDIARLESESSSISALSRRNTAPAATDRSRSATADSKLSGTMPGTSAAAHDIASSSTAAAAAAGGTSSESPRSCNGFVQRVKEIRRQRTPPSTSSATPVRSSPSATAATAAASTTIPAAKMKKSTSKKLALRVPSNLALELPSPPASSPERVCDEVNAIPKEVWYLSGLKHLSINSNSRHHAQLATDTATTSPLMSPLKRPRLRSVPLQQLGTASNNTQQLTIMSSSARVTSRNVEDSHDDLCDATENGAAKSTERCHGSDNGRKSNSRGGKHRGDSTAAEDEDAEWAVWEQNWSKVEAWIERVRKERQRLAQQRPPQQFWHGDSGSAFTGGRPTSRSGASSSREDEHSSAHKSNKSRHTADREGKHPGSRGSNNHRSNRRSNQGRSHNGSGATHRAENDIPVASAPEKSSDAAGPLPDKPLWARIEAYEQAVKEMMMLAPAAATNNQVVNGPTAISARGVLPDSPEAPPLLEPTDLPSTKGTSTGTVIPRAESSGEHSRFCVSVKDIPWPHPRESVLGIDDTSNNQQHPHRSDSVSSKRRKLRRALLFWHPDHFHRSVKFLLTQQQQEALSCNTKSTRENSGYYSAGDREEDILSRARAVTRRIIAEKEALGL